VKVPQAPPPSFYRLQLRESHLFVALTIVVGVLAGLSAVLFAVTIDLLNRAFFGFNPSTARLIAIPVAVSIVTGILMRRVFHGIRGSGIPQTKAAYHLHSGLVSPLVPVGKFVAGTLAIGGGFTAVVVGLAAQQTLGNMLAGLVLITNRPFRVGERVRLQAGPLAGQVEGVVGQLGLFYTTLVSGADRILVPNGVLIQCAVTPLREPERVEFRARFGAETSPREVQEMIEDEITVPLRYPPHIGVEELDRADVVVRIVATPLNPRDGAKLAEEVLAGVRTSDGADAESDGNRNGGRRGNGDGGPGPT
jgi:hypothetical protein